MSDVAAPWEVALHVMVQAQDPVLFEAVRRWHPVALMALSAHWASYHLRLRKDKPEYGSTKD
jgi:hypothetical protein